jgi:hypothetical protein
MPAGNGAGNGNMSGGGGGKTAEQEARDAQKSAQSSANNYRDAQRLANRQRARAKAAKGNDPYNSTLRRRYTSAADKAQRDADNWGKDAQGKGLSVAGGRYRTNSNPPASGQRTPDSPPPSGSGSGSGSGSRSGGSGGGGTGGGSPSVPSRPKAPSFDRDKANVAKHTKTLLYRAIKEYGPGTSTTTPDTKVTGADGKVVSATGDSNRLTGGEYKTFRTNYLKTHRKAAAGISDESIRALGRYLKGKGKGKALFGQPATTPPATTPPTG